VGFNVANHDIHALNLALMHCPQHGISFAYASDITQENFEFAPRLLLLFCLDIGQQRIRIGAFGFLTHF
jgi:hypothetical protein